MPSVELVSITKRYGRITAAENVNLRIEDKEYVCIIGPSGCGKTTLIKGISGITEPTEGEVYIDGKLMEGVPIQDRGVGYVFQEIALFPHMDVYGNVSYGPTVKGWEPSRTGSLVEEMLNMMALQERVNDQPDVLSGGAQQKTAIARALASGSLLLLLDEPLGSLDVKVRGMLRHELRRMVKDLGLTAIHVTHDQVEAMAVADRIVVMKAGRIVEVGIPLQLYLHPKRLFTANFVGEANFMVGEILEETSDGMKVKVNDAVLFCSQKVKFEDRRVVLAVRPEFVRMRKAGVAEESWKGRIENKVFTGSTVRYEVRAENGESVVVRQPFTSDAYMRNLGDTINLFFPPRSLLLYPYPEEGLEKEISVE
ncbi:MAG: ABC transporter ATP-binding protein [Candidatus Bathyarchaeota archaeon]|nr:ABC transporter ATP-binding protein [Candidatus Bathyarchaeota archaeon]